MSSVANWRGRAGCNTDSALPKAALVANVAALMGAGPVGSPLVDAAKSPPRSTSPLFPALTTTAEGGWTTSALASAAVSDPPSSSESAKMARNRSSGGPRSVTTSSGSGGATAALVSSTNVLVVY
eukprot:scaffold12948_cov23-Tisochrysis_lutea.AAC.2